MPFTLAPATAADVPTMIPLVFEVMHGKSVYTNALLPDNLNPAVQARHAQTFLDLQRTDDSQRWLKATDDESGATVAAALWLYWDGSDRSGRSEEWPAHDVPGDEGTWDSVEDREWANELYRGYMEVPWARVREGKKVLLLYILMVSDDYQKRGVGRVMTKWGTKLADEVGAECILYSSNNARPLYESEGFVFERNVQLEASEKFADRPDVWQALMTRPKK